MHSDSYFRIELIFFRAYMRFKEKTVLSVGR